MQGVRSTDTDIFRFDSSDTVHVWLVPLKIAPSFLHDLQSLLSEDERQRAARFRFDRHRQAYISARGQLRLLLGNYLKKDPQTIRFSYNEFGKPFLKESVLFFNISHSGAWALMAFHPRWELGVDIEQMKKDFDGLHLVERFFSQNEIEQIRALPDSLKKEGFYNGWTRKEAYIKARGRGLNIPLSEFSVELRPHQRAALLETAHDPKAVEIWSLQSLPAPEGYKAAIVAKTPQFKISLKKGDHLNALLRT